MMKVGIDNYGLFPLNLSPEEVLEWAVRNNAEGVAFSGIQNRKEERFSNQALDSIRESAKNEGLYLEWGGGQHLPYDMTSHQPKEIFSFNKIVAEEAARLECKLVRSCSGGLMRWHNEGPSTEEYLSGMAKELKKIQPVLKDLDVFWAIETHFEFTSFELIRLFEDNGFYPGENIGICLDTMNLLTMLEDPVLATKRLMPWILTTHIKDGGLVQNDDGLTSYPASIGDGWIPLDEIISLIKKEGRVEHLNVEDHNGSFFLPIYNQDFTNEFPDLTPLELKKLLDLACISQSCRDKITGQFMNRDIWPFVCEDRMQGDIQALLKIRDQIEHE